MVTMPLLFNDVDGYEVLVIILVVLIFLVPKVYPALRKPSVRPCSPFGMPLKKSKVKFGSLVLTSKKI